MNDFFEYLLQNPFLAAVLLILVGIWVIESLRARSRFERGEKLDRRSWIVIALTLAILAGAALIFLPQQLDRARSAAERAVERHQKQQEEIRRLQEETMQQN
jgi:hypothetical protein